MMILHVYNCGYRIFVSFLLLCLLATLLFLAQFYFLYIYLYFYQALSTNTKLISEIIIFNIEIKKFIFQTI